MTNRKSITHAKPSQRIGHTTITLAKYKGTSPIYSSRIQAQKQIAFQKTNSNNNNNNGPHCEFPLKFNRLYWNPRGCVYIPPHRVLITASREAQCVTFFSVVAAKSSSRFDGAVSAEPLWRDPHCVSEKNGFPLDRTITVSLLLHTHTHTRHVTEPRRIDITHSGHCSLWILLSRSSFSHSSYGCGESF